MQRFFAVCLILVLLASCAGEQVNSAPTPPATPTNAQPTPKFEGVTDQPLNLEPTTAAQPSPASSVKGSLAWRDQILRNDSVVLQITGLSAPADGSVYAAWLVGKDTSLPLGQLQDVGGNQTLNFISPNQENLLKQYAQVYVGAVAPDQVNNPPQKVLLSGTLPEKALVHIRHGLVAIPATPGEIGFALGLRQETDELLRHAQFLQEAVNAQNLALAQNHAEHIINIISGGDARDVNGDGKLQNPGDGFGLLENQTQDGYIKGMISHANLAATADDATDNIKLHAGHVQIAGENTQTRVQQIRDLAEEISKAGSLDAITTPALTLLAVAQQTIQGVDTNLDEQIGPIAGEGGVLTAYQHSQLMAGVELTPKQVEVNAPRVADIANPNSVFEIEISDNKFSKPKLTVPVGAKVVWKHNGQKPHTVTADDGSFDSGNMQNGATFEQSFANAGTFNYFCNIHGGKGGQGMAAAIVVVAGSASQPTPPPVPVPPSGDKVQVAIGDNSFTPKEISIPVGGTVAWLHNGQRPHTVTADDGSFDSGNLKNGATFEQTFTTPGTFAYFCDIHGGKGGQGMSAIIKVGDGSSQAPPPQKVEVKMKDFAFDQANLTIKVGSTVTWTNNGNKPHSAHAVDNSFDTGLFQPSESRSVTFDKPGTFVYYCELHGSSDGSSGMIATITVEP